MKIFFFFHPKVTKNASILKHLSKESRFDVQSAHYWCFECKWEHSCTVRLDNFSGDQPSHRSWGTHPVQPTRNVKIITKRVVYIGGRFLFINRTGSEFCFICNLKKIIYHQLNVSTFCRPGVTLKDRSRFNYCFRIIIFITSCFRDSFNSSINRIQQEDSVALGSDRVDWAWLLNELRIIIVPVFRLFWKRMYSIALSLAANYDA